MKVTPAHDPNDFALGQRHHLPSINVMDDTAHINDEGGKYAGLDRFVARKKSSPISRHRASSPASKTTSTTSAIATAAKPSSSRASRFSGSSKSSRWPTRPSPPSKKATSGLRPEMYEKTYLNWMENIHDWCISRQLWWGHRIPAWHCAACHKTTVSREDPDASAPIAARTKSPSPPTSSTPGSRPACSPSPSSAGPSITSENRRDFDTFYPTSLLVTGFDILFFWVARMIMMGCWFSLDVKMPDGSDRPLSESVPFREVYIHALVRDANREKMSKTKGNVIDPIEIVKQYGTDAVRFTLASMASPGTDIAFNVARTEGYRAFANKIWNAARFMFMNVDSAAEAGITIDPAVPRRPCRRPTPARPSRPAG